MLQNHGTFGKQGGIIDPMGDEQNGGAHFIQLFNDRKNLIDHFWVLPGGWLVNYQDFWLEG